jgi:hypothetical protein
MTITFVDEGDGEVGVKTKFAENIPVERLYSLVGTAIAGMVEMATSIGEAKGMTREEVQAAIFDED